MAAPAGGGGSAVSVLAPNGRRHTVKVTPSTVLLQVRRRRRRRPGERRRPGGLRWGRGAESAPAVGSGGPRGRDLRGWGPRRPMSGLLVRRARPLPAPGSWLRDSVGPYGAGVGLAGVGGRHLLPPYGVHGRAPSRVPVPGRPPAGCPPGVRPWRLETDLLSHALHFLRDSCCMRKASRAPLSRGGCAYREGTPGCAGRRPQGGAVAD